MKGKVMIDPGHGGSDPGAVGFGLKEKDVALDISRDIANIADYTGDFRAYMTRAEDINLSLQKRVKMANEDASVCVFVSIHTNGFKDENANGIESLYFPGSDRGQRLASLIQKELITLTTLTDRGIKERGDLWILRGTRMPALLLECGFITNRNDALYLRLRPFRSLYSVGVVRGLKRYFGSV